jgi:hypothetical protein
LVRPGPGDVGTEIVDPNGNIVYSADQVAANPALANIPTGGCPTGMVPTWYPGGQSECAVPGAQGGTYIAGTPIGQCDDPSGLCQGSTFQGQTIQTPVDLEAIPTGLPVQYYQAQAAPAAASGSVPVSASIQNQSRPGQPFQVGDTWLITVTGPANSPVSNTATQNGNLLGTTPYGSTDGSGNFTLSGQMTAGTVGSWTESWSVGGVAASPLSFSVSAAAPAPSGGTSSGGSATTPASSSGSSTPSTSASPGSCFSLLSSFGVPDPCVGSFPVGLTTIAAGVVAVMLLSSMFGGKK